MNKIFINDHSKVIKDKRQLISIENHLEKERREIQEVLNLIELKENLVKQGKKSRNLKISIF